MTSRIILGSPFIHQIMPFMVIDEGIVMEKLGEKIVFNFVKKLVFRNLNLVENKEKQINFLSEEIIFKRIEQNLKDPILQSKIKSFGNYLQNQICSDLPNAFWKRKQHMVELPYEKIFRKEIFLQKLVQFK